MTQKEANKLYTKNIIDVDIFLQSIHVFFTKEDCMKAMQWRGDNHDLNNTGGICYESVLINKDDESEECLLCMGIFNHTASTVMHESIHMANFILSRIGFVAKDKYDEIVPYLSTYIFNKCIALM